MAPVNEPPLPALPSPSHSVLPHPSPARPPSVPVPPPLHSPAFVVPHRPPPPFSMRPPPFSMLPSSSSPPRPVPDSIDLGSSESFHSASQIAQGAPIPFPFSSQSGALPGLVVPNGAAMQYPPGAPLFIVQSNGLGVVPPDPRLPVFSHGISSHFLPLQTPPFVSGAFGCTQFASNQLQLSRPPTNDGVLRMDNAGNSSFQSLLMSVSANSFGPMQPNYCHVRPASTNSLLCSGASEGVTCYRFAQSGCQVSASPRLIADACQVGKQVVDTPVTKPPKPIFDKHIVEASSDTETSTASGSLSFNFGLPGKISVPAKRRAGRSSVQQITGAAQQTNLSVTTNTQHLKRQFRTPAQRQDIESDTEFEESDEEVETVPNEDEVLRELGIVEQPNQVQVEDEYESDTDTCQPSDSDQQYQDPPELVIDSSDDSDSDEDNNHHHSEAQGTSAGSDVSLKFEINQTVFGDCGCSSGKTMYKKRKRVRKGTVRPDCRTPRGMGAIEIAMRNSTNRTTEFIFEPVLGLVFDSRAEAYQFYNLFSWEVGFGIRFGNSSYNRGNGYKTMQELVCEKQGFDSRCTKSSKRDGCKAMIRLHRTEDFGWYVSKHVAAHNHPLSVSCGEKREWNSHSKIEQCTKDMILYLRENNVTLSRVHCIMGSLFGSMEDVPFNQKTLRAVCKQIASDQRDDDVTKTLRIFRKMRQEDPGFQFAVDTDENNKIKTLIWVSGRSRSQWNYFGDVVTFDTTYCTNLYKMPFGMFVGVNNHFQSVLFAGVLMRDETARSFKWVFNEFLTLMGSKAPVTILTDQCKAMAKALRSVMPDTTHLWCKWHVLKTAPEELGPIYRVNSPFRREFHYVVNEMLTVDEFEKAWNDLLDRYELHGNKFMEKTYNKRLMWAKPWSKHVFCARMTSTQRSESANSFLKKVVPRNSSMNRFVEQYRKLLFMRNAAEETSEHNTKQFEWRGKRMYAVEKHALSVYTKKAFMLFSAEVDKASQYVVHGGNGEFQVVHINDKVRKNWARGSFIVSVSDDGEKYNCECGLYDHFGILCCHAIKVMIHNGVAKIPECHILKRWTRNARDVVYPDLVDQMVDSVTNQLKQSLLYGDALDVVRKANNDSDIHDIVRRNLKITNQEIERLMEWRMSQPGYEQATEVTVGDGKHISVQSDCDDAPTNTYGASGSSAYMSDSDIESILAPDVNRPKGRPKEVRFKRAIETKCKKKKKKHSVALRIPVTVARKPPVSKKASKCSSKRQDDLN